MITLSVTKQCITIVSRTDICEELVSGTIGQYQCEFRFSEEWEGYIKTAVFQPIIDDACDTIILPEEEPISVILDDDNRCYIPSRVLKPNQRLRIGVFGVNGDKTLPTTYSVPLLVRLGAVVGEPSGDEDVTAYQQILEIVEMLEIALSGGTQGQVLTKLSDDDFDVGWRAGGGASTYVYTQLTASDSWDIRHMLDKFPSTVVIDSSGNIVMGEIIYIDSNELQLNFSAPFSGVAYLN